MENLKTIGIAGLVAAVIAIGTIGLTRDEVVQSEQPVFGALSSPDIVSPYFSFGGVREWAASVELRQASTSLCAIQSPAATTTLTSASLRVDFATTTAQQLEIGKATTAFATTTRLAIVSIAANASTHLVATTSATALQDGIVAPYSWINAQITAGVGGAAGNVPTGRCNVVFREI